MFLFNRMGARLPLLAALLVTGACTQHVTNVVAAQASATSPGPAVTPPAANSISGGVVHVKRAVVSGARQRLDFASAVNPDCSVFGTVTLKVKASPAHGTIAVESATDFPTYPKENPRSVCNTKRVSGTSLFYASEPGYTGLDQVTYETIFPDGAFRTIDLQITVE